MLLASDSFAGGADQDLVSYNSAWAYEIVTNGGDGILVNSSGAHPNVLSGVGTVVAKYSTVTFPNDQWTQFTLSDRGTGQNDYIGLALRVGGTATTAYYLIFSTVNDPTNYYDMRVYSGGTGTSLIGGIQTGLTWNNGDVMYFSVQGTTLNFYQNGILRKTATDATLTSGRAGISATQGAKVSPLATMWSAGDFNSVIAWTV